MNAFSDTDELVLSVSELNRLARITLEKNLPSCWVRGEISNYSRASSGHWYFTLKDSEAGARCVMFRTRNQFVDWTPRDGDQVELRAQPTLYEQRGDYQLLVDAMRKSGQGSLFEAFLKLKAKLEAEGLFSHSRKRCLPPFPRSIGIITSPQAAALRDVLSTLLVRWPACGVFLYPTPVQGDETARGLMAAINTAGLRHECDVLLLVRGGGSLEDLRGFNDEGVARAIAACPLPLISGVGHETDFTIADFVADLRAPTPTGAAQMATPSRTDLRQELQHLHARINQAQQRKLHTLSQRVDGLRKSVSHPRERVALRRQQIAHMGWRLSLAMDAGAQRNSTRLLRLYAPLTAIKQNIGAIRQKVTSLGPRLHAAAYQALESHKVSTRILRSHLELLSPPAVLRRGYSIVRNKQGHVIRYAEEVGIGQIVDITLAHGLLETQILQISDSAD